MDKGEHDYGMCLFYYNNERTHPGKYCYGKTPPMQTFTESIDLAREKRIDEQIENHSIFNESKQTETDSAEEQPVRNILTDGNNKAVDHHFYGNRKKSKRIRVKGKRVKQKEEHSIP